jgi:serine/threonine-protein kinase
MEGQRDEALHWLRKAIQIGNDNYPLLRDSSKLAALRGEPAFVELLEDQRVRWEARVRAESASGA